MKKRSFVILAMLATICCFAVILGNSEALSAYLYSELDENGTGLVIGDDFDDPEEPAAEGTFLMVDTNDMTGNLVNMWAENRVYAGADNILWIRGVFGEQDREEGIVYQLDYVAEDNRFEHELVAGAATGTTFFESETNVY